MMNDRTNNITEMMTRYKCIYLKSTFTIPMARFNHLSNVMRGNVLQLIRKVNIYEIFKLEWDEKKGRVINIKKISCPKDIISRKGDLTSL